MPYSIDHNQAAKPEEIRSEDLNEVISQVPSVLIRWGITVFFTILFLLLLGCYVIRYPDIVTASFELTSQNAPKPVVARIEGKLVKLFADENDRVAEGQVVAHLESTADYQDVIALTKWLDSVSTYVNQNESAKIISIRKPGLYHLGELQSPYIVFDKAYVELLTFLPGGYQQQKKQLLESELATLALMKKGLEGQHKLYQRDYELEKAEYDIQKSLVQQKVIAASELKREESELVAKEISLQQIQARILDNLTAQITKEKEVLELEKLISEQKNAFLQATSLLESSISDWERKYLLVAPSEGKIHFNTFVQENQHLQAGQEIFFVSAPSNYEFGEIKIPQYNLGKIREGQEVLIKLDSYPFQEFGMVKGKIEFISEIPTEEGLFIAKVGLPNGLVTTHQKQLTYRSGMTASAEIITQSNRLIEKIFYGLRGAMSV